MSIQTGNLTRNRMVPRRRRALASVLCSKAVLAGLGLLVLSQPAFTVPVQKTAGVALISAGGGAAALTGVGAPVGAFIGGFQIGWGIGCLLFDPPDIANAGVPVSFSDYSGFTLPDVETLYPATPASLASALNSYADIMDMYVASVRADRESLDRASGAMVIGRLDLAADRLSEAITFQNQANAYAAQAAAAMPWLLGVINSLDPSISALPVTLADTLAVRDDMKNGVFPPFEDFALAAWAVTPEEIDTLKTGMGNIPDSVFEAMFQELDPVNGSATTFDKAVAHGTALCATCLPPVPEPSTWLLLCIGLAGLWGFGPMRKRAGDVHLTGVARAT